ncbi:conserved hypothetical protein [Ricinus communis]|uniref:Uncharacterized protein n=1 Tax=Ricinus communis TaxID=3988 RepID=B9T630_RICCO|nr:conserved hypothetical protein [Ricinus communis]|eukprot:XP_002533699.1 uncharacterized protein LOC8277655 [Ricinus communis]
MCSQTSPRISFSNDLSQDDDIPIDRRDTTLLESSCDFEFSICSSIDQYSSLADELFADGMILPVRVPETGFSPPNNRVHRYDEVSPRVSSLPPLPCSSTNGGNSKKEIMVLNSELEEKTQSSKSFWGFKRSSSLNCDIKKSLCSLPLLSRSNSTGSVPNPKHKPTSCKDLSKNNSQKQLSRKSSASPPASSASTYVYALPHKPPLKKHYGGSHGKNNGLKFSPVLNVPPPYIAKGAANLFGLGSFFRNGKEESKK